jgi:hypothetical protein
MTLAIIRVAYFTFSVQGTGLWVKFLEPAPISRLLCFGCIKIAGPGYGTVVFCTGSAGMDLASIGMICAA